MYNRSPTFTTTRAVYSFFPRQRSPLSNSPSAGGPTRCAHGLGQVQNGALVCVCRPRERHVVELSLSKSATETYLSCSFSWEESRGNTSFRPTPSDCSHLYLVIRAPLRAEPGGKTGCLGKTDSNRSRVPKATAAGLQTDISISRCARVLIKVAA